MKLLRTWATPAVGAIFLVVGVTGTMMFFHLGERAVKELHEWLGVAFVVAGLLHVVMEELAGKLEAAGVSDPAPESTLASLAGPGEQGADGLLAALLPDAGPPAGPPDRD